MLLFEALKGPVGSTQADANQVNDRNLRFLNVVRNTGKYQHELFCFGNA